MPKVATSPASPSNPRTRWALWALAAGAAVLVVAWVDGGEEPLHAIEKVVTVSAESVE